MELPRSVDELGAYPGHHLLASNRGNHSVFYYSYQKPLDDIASFPSGESIYICYMIPAVFDPSHRLLQYDGINLLILNSSQQYFDRVITPHEAYEILARKYRGVKIAD